MPKNDLLFGQIITAGEQAGLHVDYKSIKNCQPEGRKSTNDLTDQIFFTLRSIEEYQRNFRPSWTRMGIRPVTASELGEEDELTLVFETEFNLAMVTGDESVYPMIVIEDVLDRIMDFTKSCPAEAANLFVTSFQWHMNLAGEIIYEPAEDEAPILDFDIFPTLEIHTEVIQLIDPAEFDHALATLSADSLMGQAIQAMMEQLALLFRWFDTETPPRPPRLSRILNE